MKYRLLQKVEVDMRSASFCLVAVFLFTSVFAPRASSQEKKPEDKKAANLLVNGSFEEGPEPGEFTPLDKGSTEIKGWVVTRGQIDYIGGYWKAAAGKRSLDLHGSPGFGGVQQSFATRKGQKYRVTFSLAGNPEGEEKKMKMGVQAAGQKEEFTFDTTDKSRDAMGWVTKTWEFKATEAETTLELYSLMDVSDAFGPAIDNVVVVATEK